MTPPAFIEQFVPMDEEPKVVEKVEKPKQKAPPKRKEKSPEPPKDKPRAKTIEKPKPIQKGKLSHISLNFYYLQFLHAQFFSSRMDETSILLIFFC